MGISVALPDAPAGVRFNPLMKENFVMICPRDDILARRKRVDWSVFASRPFVASGPASSIRLVTDRVLATTDPPTEARLVADNISVVGALVAAGVGIAAVPELALRLMDGDRLQSVALHSPVATREIGVLTKKQRSLSAAAKAFFTTLQDVRSST